MKKMCNRYLKSIVSDQGVTLVELLAAIAILSIIVTSFLAFFIQAAQTNNRTSNLNEATFIAQQELEYFTYLSNNYDFDGALDELMEDRTVVKHSDHSYTITRTEENQQVTVDFNRSDTFSTDYTHLYEVKVRADTRGTATQMEARLPFERGD